MVPADERGTLRRLGLGAVPPPGGVYVFDSRITAERALSKLTLGGAI